MQDIVIYLLKGFSGLNFGEPAKNALQLFGQPDETEELFDELINEKSLVYHYWERGFSLFFKDDELKTFTCAEVDYDKAILFGEKVFLLKEEKVIELFSKNGYKLTETEQHAWGEKRLSFDDAFADLYYEKGKLISINFCIPDYLPGMKLNLN
jgi:hypothetical protein